MTQRFCRSCSGWHDLNEPWPGACLGHFSSLKADRTVHVIGDSMNALKHPATGRVTDSKSQFRRDTKASGCVEVGNEPIRQAPRPKLHNPRADIARALERY